MAKLYATLENSKGKTVSISDNNQITATVYDGNMKAYSVIIEWTELGDIIDDLGHDLPKSEKTEGAMVFTREWRNQPEENRKRKVKDTGKKPFEYHEGARYIDCKGVNTDYCDRCGYTNR